MLLAGQCEMHHAGLGKVLLSTELNNYLCVLY